MWQEIIFALWFFLPAGVANAVPVFAARLPGLRHWNTPLDLGKSLRGRRIFGDHKTWRGLITGTLAGAVVGLAAYPPLLVFAEQDAEFLGKMALTGALLGLGALTGDAVKSFFKRRANVSPGGSWFPFDQTDYIIGGLLFVSSIAQLRWSQYLWILGTWFILHLVVVYVGYLLRIREKPI